MDFIQTILERKRPSSKEISVVLFEQCNNACSFCYQTNDERHNASVEMILDKIDTTKSAIDKIKKPIKLKLLGGELFFDTLPDKIIEAYKYYIEEIIKYCEKQNKKLEIGFATNLLYTKLDRLIDLIDYVKSFGIVCNISTSFDFWGRFHNKQHYLLWKENLYKMQKHLTVISMVLSKPNIMKFMKKEESVLDDIDLREEFDDLYKDNFKFFFEYYNPDSNSFDVATPSDRDVLEFFKYLVDNYPEVQPIPDFLDEKPNKELYCESLVCINCHGEVCGCRSTSIKGTNLFDEGYEQDKDNTIIENAFVNKYKCLTCPKFSICPLGCFMFFSLKENKSTCIFKELFDYIERKGNAGIR